MNKKRRYTYLIILAVSLSLFLLDFTPIPGKIADSILYWVQRHELRTETDPDMRMILVNMTRDAEPSRWNSEYLQLTLKAETRVERLILADIIHERFGTNAIRECENLSERNAGNPSVTNVLAVLELIRAEAKQSS